MVQVNCVEDFNHLQPRGCLYVKKTPNSFHHYFGVQGVFLYKMVHQQKPTLHHTLLVFLSNTWCVVFDSIFVKYLLYLSVLKSG